MSKLLLNENPLVIIPELACRAGLNEALILQQIHYWIEINKKANQNLRNGYYWTYNSYEQWNKQFPFWHVNTIKKTIANLEKAHLVITDNFNKLKIDRTKWYRIDNKALETLESSPLYNICTTNIQKWYDHYTKNVRPLPEINSEINSETNKKIGSFPKEKPEYISFDKYLNITNIKEYGQHVKFVKYYLDKYKKVKSKRHPLCTWQEWSDAIINMFSNNVDEDLQYSVEENSQIMTDIIDKHFQKHFKQYNHDIRSFNKFIDNDMYEAGII